MAALREAIIVPRRNTAGSDSDNNARIKVFTLKRERQQRPRQHDQRAASD